MSLETCKKTGQVGYDSLRLITGACTIVGALLTIGILFKLTLIDKVKEPLQKMHAWKCILATSVTTSSFSILQLGKLFYNLIFNKNKNERDSTKIFILLTLGLSILPIALSVLGGLHVFNKIQLPTWMIETSMLLPVMSTSLVILNFLHTPLCRSKVLPLKSSI